MDDGWITTSNGTRLISPQFNVVQGETYKISFDTVDTTATSIRIMTPGGTARNTW